MISKGLLCHLVNVNNLDHDISSIDYVHVVNEFQDVFPNDLPGVPPPQAINFAEKGLKYPQSWKWYKITLHPPFGSKIPFSPTYWV